MSDNTPWQSINGQQNALALRSKYAEGFYAIGEYDRIGHLLLHRAANRSSAHGLQDVVGVAILRRAVMLFAGVRALLEQSLPDVAKAPARAYFELLLNYRCLAYGGTHPITLETPTLRGSRESRARRYYVAAERRALRTRALALSPRAQYQAPSKQDWDSLRQELLDEIARLKRTFPEEWNYFGDVDEGTVIRHVGGRAEPTWFAAEFPGRVVNSVASLAAAFGNVWEYDVLYDAFSALVHSRGARQDISVAESTLAVHHPHDPIWFEMITWFVVNWHLLFLMTAAKWHSPEMIPHLQALHTKHREALATMQPRSIPNLLS